MGMLDDPDKRITELAYALQCRNERLDLKAPSYGDVRRLCKIAIEELKMEQERAGLIKNGKPVPDVAEPLLTKDQPKRKAKS